MQQHSTDIKMITQKEHSNKEYTLDFEKGSFFLLAQHL